MRRLAILVPFGFFFGLYAYVLVRLLSALGAPGLVGWSLAAALSVLHIGAFSFRLRGKSGAAEDAASWLSYVVLSWGASLLVLSVVRDVVWAALWALGALGVGALADIGAAWAPVNMGVLGASVLLAGVGYVEARRRPRVRRVDIPVAGLPDAWAGFTIAQLTDIHVGPTIKRDFLDPVVDATLALGADVIAITGDLVDGGVPELAEHVAPLSRLQADKGVYFVTGNHEYYAGAEAWVEHVRTLGIDVLMNEHRVLDEENGRALVVAGVTDFNAGSILPHHRCDPAAALEGAPEGVRVMLAHQPRTALLLDALDDDVDLLMAGHTHGGQFWPWHLFVKLQQPVVEGLDRLGDRWVYTSRGTGYWGPPNRLGAPSEISLLRLVPA